MWVAGIVSLVLILLSALHWYWVFGGQFGLNAVLPSTGNKRAFSPSPVLTAFVAVSLLLAALICLLHGNVFGLTSSVYSRIGVGGLGFVFGLRALGDFRFAGIFKRVRGTSFARMDTRLFTPLCIVVSAMCWWLF